MFMQHHKDTGTWEMFLYAASCNSNKYNIYKSEEGCHCEPEQYVTSAVVDTTFVDIYVDKKNIPTCRYNIQHIDKRTMEK